MQPYFSKHFRQNDFITSLFPFRHQNYQNRENRQVFTLWLFSVVISRAGLKIEIIFCEKYFWILFLFLKILSLFQNTMKVLKIANKFNAKCTILVLLKFTETSLTCWSNLCETSLWNIASKAIQNVFDFYWWIYFVPPKTLTSSVELFLFHSKFTFTEVLTLFSLMNLPT